MKWRILARHEWIVGALVTESVNDDDTSRRYTATIRGYRNWRIFEGAVDSNSLSLIVRVVRAIRDQVDADGEDCEAFMAVNEYSHNVAELESRLENEGDPTSMPLEHRCQLCRHHPATVCTECYDEAAQRTAAERSAAELLDSCEGVEELLSRLLPSLHKLRRILRQASDPSFEVWK